jgi:hypothetical protein
MTRWALWLVAVLAPLGAACGGLVQEDVGMGSAGAGAGPDSGTDFEVAAQADTEVAGATGRDRGVESATEADAGTLASRRNCPGWEGEIEWEYICYWQLLEPAGPDDQRAFTATCEIPCSRFLLNPNENRVHANCQPIPFILGPPDERVPVGDAWWFDNPQAPGVIFLSDALCSRLREDGFQRIDILYACPPRSLP